MCASGFWEQISVVTSSIPHVKEPTEHRWGGSL